MEPIRVYSDEAYASGVNFRISTLIYGSPRVCDDFQKWVERFVRENEKEIGNSEYTFKGRKLNSKNWSRLSKYYLTLVDGAIRCFQENALGLIITIESREKYDANIRFLECEILRGLFDKNCELGEIFQFLQKDDIHILWKSAENFYDFNLNQTKIGNMKSEFWYMPDSKGDVLNYQDRILPVVSIIEPTKGIVLFLPAFEVIAMLTNNLNTVLQKNGWQKKNNQKLKKYNPMRDEESYIIQTADVFSNFLYHLIRYLVGIEDTNSEKKATELIKRLFSKKLQDQIKKNFSRKENRCVCINNELKSRITFKPESGFLPIEE